jgi:hypothetical protein
MTAQVSCSMVTATSPLGGQTNLVALNISNEAAADIMMMALVASFSAILFRQLDAFAFDTINSPDMRPVGSMTSMCSLT